MPSTDLDHIRELVKRNRYLTLSTTDGSHPWVAPLEYISDHDLNLYFFSPETTIHALHIGERNGVAVAIFDAVQPEYESAQVIRIAGLQMTAVARKLKAPLPALVENQVEAWGLPMPPYAAYQITPQQLFLPVIRDGVNERMEVARD